MSKDAAYKTKQSLTDFLKVCEGLIVKWQKAQYNEGIRGDKRKEGHYDTERDKKQRADVTAPAFKSGEYSEGCGIPRHRRESCNLTIHPDYNQRLDNKRDLESVLKSIKQVNTQLASM